MSIQTLALVGNVEEADVAHGFRHFLVSTLKEVARRSRVAGRSIRLTNKRHGIATIAHDTSDAVLLLSHGGKIHFLGQAHPSDLDGKDAARAVALDILTK